MTKGELIVASIKLMFDNDTEHLDTDTISDNTNYISRTANIVESYNRAMNEIAKAGKLPKKTLTLDHKIGTKGENYTRYNLDTLNILGFSKDVMQIVNVNYEGKANDYPIYYTNVGFQLEGNNTLILPNITEGNYIVTYRPKFTDRMTYSDTDNTILNYPSEILDIVPYFIKGELYEEDDPEKAVLSLNKFQKYLAELPSEPNMRQTKVTTVFTVF